MRTTLAYPDVPYHDPNGWGLGPRKSRFAHTTIEYNTLFQKTLWDILKNLDLALNLSR